MWRREVRPFTDKQVALVRTFADQAVIAIENVRLFNELQEKNCALTQAHAQVTESLDQQTTTSEILRVISSSPTDVRPVFDAIVRGAQRLLGAQSAAAFQLIGDIVHRVAATVGGPGPAVLYPMPLDQMRAANPAAGRVWTQAELWHVTDTEADVYLTSAGRSLARSSGYRSLLWIPLVRDREVVGVIAVTRPGPGGFTDAEIALLRTFADQAVIAIENVRLFTELQEKNNELTQANAQVTEALEQQTATSEILRVISRSPTDVQPVFKAIARSAVRLSGGVHGGVLRLSDDVLSVVAYENLSSTSADLLLSFYPTLLDRAGLVGLAIRDRTSFIRQMSSAIRGQLILSSPGVRAIRASWPFRSCALASRSGPFS
jgi:GAF domain-containing protein